MAQKVYLRLKIIRFSGGGEVSTLDSRLFDQANERKFSGSKFEILEKSIQ
jgi:hypothetical protein